MRSVFLQKDHQVKGPRPVSSLSSLCRGKVHFQLSEPRTKRTGEPSPLTGHGPRLPPEYQGDIAVRIRPELHPSTLLISHCRKAPEEGIFSYPLRIRDPLTKYVRGRVVVIGDAAHTFRPVSAPVGTQIRSPGSHVNQATRSRCL